VLRISQPPASTSRDRYLISERTGASTSTTSTSSRLRHRRARSWASTGAGLRDYLEKRAATGAVVLRSS